MDVRIYGEIRASRARSEERLGGVEGIVFGYIVDSMGMMFGR